MNEKILVIEDEDEIRESISDILELHEFEVILAEDGEVGITRAKKELPDLIISDILMPNIDGYEVFNTLQKNKKTQLIPFVFLTAKAELKDIRTGLSMGADDYIVKPFSADDLVNSVKTRLEKYKKIRKLYRTPADNDDQKLNYDEIMLVMSGGKPQFVNLTDIKYLTADSQYSHLFLSESRCLIVRKTLKEWEEILPDKNFIRIHRSTIINVHHIDKIDKWFKRSFVVKMKGIEEPLAISQRYVVKLKNRLL